MRKLMLSNSRILQNVNKVTDNQINITTNATIVCSAGGDICYLAVSIDTASYLRFT